MKQDDLTRLVGDLARRVASAEKRTLPGWPLRPSREAPASPPPSLSLLQAFAAQQSGWLSGGVWEPFTLSSGGALSRGSGLKLLSQGIQVLTGGLYRISVAALVASTSPSTDAFLGILIDGSPLGPRVKLDPEDLLHQATGTYYDGAFLSTLASLSAGSVAAGALCIQGSPGLSMVEGQGFLLLEQLDR